MVFMFGTLGGIAVPFAFAAVTIPTTLGLVWICAHLMEMAIYVTNIVALIGFAIAYGLEHTGRIITAAAVVMIAAFAGFLTGSFVGLQEFGLGLMAAIALDATVVRAILVPATMKLLGEWNWYLPERVKRVLAPHTP
jgi:Mn2+/Fe2+ NRAMP family transporter